MNIIEQFCEEWPYALCHSTDGEVTLLPMFYFKSRFQAQEAERRTNSWHKASGLYKMKVVSTTLLDGHLLTKEVQA